MKKTIIILIGLLLTAGVVYGQPQIAWQRLYGGDASDYFEAHIRTVGGGWAFAGKQWQGFGVNNFWLVVTDEDGEVQFEGSYGDESYNQAFDLVQTEDGGYLLGGDWTNHGNEFAVVRVDAEGDLMWQETYGDFELDQCNAVLGIKDDQFLLAGYADTENLSAQAYLIKIEGDGDIIWERTYGGDERENFQDIIQVENGYTLVGRTESFGNGGGVGASDIWLVRVNEEGEEIWSQTYGDETHELGNALIRTEEDGGYALACWGLFGPLGDHAIIIKTDVDGDQQWFRRYLNEDVGLSAWDIARMPDNGYAVVGHGRVPDEAALLGYTLRVDNGGNLMWSRLDQIEQGVNHFRSVVLDDDNGITMAGVADIMEGNQASNQGWFVKLTPANLPPLIVSKTPPDSLFRVPRGGSQVFSVNAIDPEGGDLSYRWFFEGDTVSEEDMLILEFPEYDTLGLQVFISDNRWTVSTGWQIMVVPLIADWFPEDSMLTVDLNGLIRFRVEAGLPEDTLITYSWLLNQEEVSDADTVWITFAALSDSLVTVAVAARDVEESFRWHVRVNLLESVETSIITPCGFKLNQPYPNPFNAMTNISFTLPVGMPVNLSVYDINGMMIETVLEDYLQAGKYQYSIDASDLTAGIYLINLKTPITTVIHKAVVIK